MVQNLVFGGETDQPVLVGFFCDVGEDSVALFFGLFVGNYDIFVEIFSLLADEIGKGLAGLFH